MGARQDLVYVRKSSIMQEEQGQTENVERMLREAKVYISQDQWILDTGRRSKSHKREGFNRILDLVRADKVGTVYIESFSRWGIRKRQLHTIRQIFQEHGSRLYDLSGRIDYTKEDLPTEIQSLFQASRSDEELYDLSFRSQRSRLSHFLASGSWPAGKPPYGYDKAYYLPDGSLSWGFFHTSLTKGHQLHYVGGKEIKGPEATPPRKKREEICLLVPSRDKERVEAVKLIFNLFTTTSKTSRLIAIYLNERGILHYGQPWYHSIVERILRNPAYCGDTYLGRTDSSEFYSMDSKGNLNKLTEIKLQTKTKQRALEACQVKKDTHEALVSREVFQQAQEKLANRKSHPPRMPGFYLKGLLVCGHCGEEMTCHSVTYRDGRKLPGYVCRSYRRGKSYGGSVKEISCKAWSITHPQAEELILAKLKSLGLEASNLSTPDRLRYSRAQELLGEEIEREYDTLDLILMRNLKFYRKHLEGVFKEDQEKLEGLVSYAQLCTLLETQAEALRGIKPEALLAKASDFLKQQQASPLAASIRSLIEGLEAEKVRHAKAKLEEIKRKKKVLAQRFLEDVPREILAEIKEQASCLGESETYWTEQSKSLKDLLREYSARLADRLKKLEQLTQAWPEMEASQKGEALKRLLKRVVLRWEAVPKEKKTSYRLLEEQIEWGFAPDVDLSQSCLKCSFAEQLGSLLLLLDTLAPAS